jgi:hypothetical protein
MALNQESGKSHPMQGGQATAAALQGAPSLHSATRQPESGRVDAQRALGLRWFRRTVVLGFVVNMAFALPALLAPRLLEKLLPVSISNTPQWLQNVGMLLVIISVMYLPAVKDPYRYLFNAYLLIAGRFSAGVLFLAGLFFMNYPSGFTTLAANDLILSPIQAFFLYRLLRGGAGESTLG